MKLLFDQNLSPYLVTLLADLFPGTQHVHALGLDQASDQAVWDYAVEHHCTIVSRDADFSEISVILGSPPKVVWVRRGNCSTAEIEAITRQNSAAIQDLETDPNANVLALF